MTQQHKGWLHLGDRAEHLDVQLVLNRGALAVSADGATWEWPLSAVDARVWDGAEFELDLDGETVIFYSEDPLGFLFDFLPALRARRARRPIRLRSWRRRTRPGPDSQPPLSNPAGPAAATDEPADGRREPSDDPWTDMALGRAYGEVMLVLRQLYGRETPEDHPEDRAGDHGGCSECHRVFIDLTDRAGDPR